MPVSQSYLMYLRTMAEKRSVMDYLRESMAVIALGHPNYDAAQHRIVAGYPAPETGLSLIEDSAGIIQIDPSNGHALESTEIFLNGAGSIRSELAENIANVILSYSITTSGPTIEVNGTTQNTSVIGIFDVDVDVANVASNGGKNRLEVVSGTQFVSGSASFTTPGLLAGDNARLVAQINGKTSTPAVRFDLERVEYGELVEDILLSTRDLAEPLYLIGSPYAALPAFGPMFQLIGGTLEYNHGWTLDATLAPTINNAGMLTVAQLSTSTTATLGDFSEYQPGRPGQHHEWT
ncbi:hypothetical protein [Cryobacterium sp. Y62]|uniref:hypothetical protein n=1 Tax=Cryobacterium sp. Y62 TaxID=2048284 RepID=UPI0011B0CE91|nr:hypothetical protein [Cryobacterium sp. Y62]